MSTQTDSPEATDAGRPTLPGLDRYEIRERLGEGTSSVVYRAWDRQVQRPVALKLLRETSQMSALARQRFHREAQVMAALTHSHVVTLYDAGEVSGELYLVMELVEGRSMREILDEKKLSHPELAALLGKAARGLAAAHEKGVVHRDLKPENILVTRDNSPKMADFGLAHFGEGEGRLTRTGTLLGTPQYMAPEQVRGTPGGITPRTDVYGLGAILYEAITGKPPFEGESVAEICMKVANEEPRRPRRLNPAIRPELEAVCLKALERDPNRRYESAASLAQDLERFAAGEPVSARPPSFAYLAARWARRRRAFLVTTSLELVVLVVAVLAWRESRVLAYQRAYHEGREHLALGSPTEALEKFRIAADMSPGSAEANLMIGRCLVTLGRTAEAARMWDEVLRRHASHPEGLFERGKHRICAVARLRVPVAAGPNRGTNRTAPTEPEEAKEREERLAGEAELSGARGLDPVRRAFIEGALDLGAGRYEKAVKSLEEYASRNSWDGPALALTGIAHYYAGVPVETERRLTQALAFEPRPAWFKARGDALFLQGRGGEAARDYVRAGLPIDLSGIAAPRLTLEGLVLWLRTDGGVTVKNGFAEFTMDQTGSGGYFVNGSPRAQPQFVPRAQGTRPAFRFDGRDDALLLNMIPVQRAQFPEGLSVFVVARPDASGSGGTFAEFARGQSDPDLVEPGIIVGLGDDPSTLRYLPGAPKYRKSGSAESRPIEPWLNVERALRPGECQVVSLVHHPTQEVVVYRDGAEVGRGRAPVPEHRTRQRSLIGRGTTGGGTFAGDLFEFLVYERALSEAERVGLEKHLRARYSPGPAESASPAWGLRAEYFEDQELKKPHSERLEATIDADWGEGRPLPTLGENGFSVRWTGQIQPLYSEAYTFYTLCDDGVRLWIDGRLVIDNWAPHERVENRGSIMLQAGRRYDLRMEMFEGEGYAVARLAWASRSQPKEIVPSGWLLPPPDRAR
jgi:tRNA A-37 threonylcarbamoyl transferase component Bud32/tetratricopeptide (TPR) repeat protein